MLYELNTAIWEMTLNCNLKCLHCMANAEFGTEPKEDLTTKQGLQLLNDLKELGCKTVVLSGGEPFLRKEWDLFARRVVDLKMNLFFISNGTIINQDIINKLKYLNVGTVGISIDGASAKTHDFIRGVSGSFDKVINSLYLLKAANIPCSVATTVHKHNYDEIDDILNLLKEIGVRSWMLQISKPVGRMSDDFTLSEEQYYALAEKIVDFRKKYAKTIDVTEADCIGYYSKLSPDLYFSSWGGCSCGMAMVAIENDGNVKGCPCMNNSEGNIKEKSIIEIWNNPDNFAYNRHFTGDMLTGYCRECTYGNICRGGCVYNIKNETGSPYCLYKIEKVGFDKQAAR